MPGKLADSFQFANSDNLVGDEDVRYSGSCHDFGFADFCHRDAACAGCNLQFGQFRHFVRFRVRSQGNAIFIGLFLHHRDIITDQIHVDKQGGGVELTIF